MANTRIAYEWDIEVTDEYGDIIDHTFFDHNDCPTMPLLESQSLCLVKSYADPTGSYISDRTWAYVNADGLLPERFEDGTDIPKYIRAQFEKSRG